MVKSEGLIEPGQRAHVRVLILDSFGTGGFQMSIKRPTSGGQVCNQKAAVQRTFHLERSSFFCLQTAMVRTQRSAY